MMPRGPRPALTTSVPPEVSILTTEFETALTASLMDCSCSSATAGAGLAGAGTRIRPGRATPARVKSIQGRRGYLRMGVSLFLGRLLPGHRRLQLQRLGDELVAALDLQLHLLP